MNPYVCTSSAICVHGQCKQGTSVRKAVHRNRFHCKCVTDKWKDMKFTAFAAVFTVIDTQ